MDDDGGIRLPEAFDDLNIGITLHDADTGAVLDGNDRLAELYGYPIAELRTMAVEEYTAPTTRFTQEKATERIRAAAAGDPQVFEWQVERKNGELRWVRVHLNRTTIDDTTCVVAEIEDITEYRARERRLRLLSRIVRHNLRNRTNVLMGYADRIKAAIEDERLAENADTVYDIALELGTLSESVREIEEIAEPDAASRGPTNLHPLVASVVEDARGEYPDASFSIEADGEVWVIADEGIRYATKHAVSNAVVHNDREGPVVEVTVRDEPHAGRGLIQVADDGPTIPETETAVLQEQVETSSTYHGTGVGLWVMQWCVDSLGGDLSFAERSPRGNVVTMSLPSAPNERAAE